MFLLFFLFICGGCVVVRSGGCVVGCGCVNVDEIVSVFLFLLK